MQRAMSSNVSCFGRLKTPARAVKWNAEPVVRRGILLLFSAVLMMVSFAGHAAAQTHQAVTTTLRAIEDFPRLEVPGFVPFYVDSEREVLAINSVIYPDTFAAAETVWQGESGIYNVSIHTVPENDGECLYRLHVNGRLVGEFTNPKVPEQWGLAIHAWPAVEIRSGDVIRVTANNASNGVVPEGEGFAYARGRWSHLYLIKLRGI